MHGKLFMKYWLPHIEKEMISCHSGRLAVVCTRPALHATTKQASLADPHCPVAASRPSDPYSNTTTLCRKMTRGLF